MARMVTLTIDDVEVTVPEGTTILDAAEKVGIKIPTLCHDTDFYPYVRPWVKDWHVASAPCTNRSHQPWLVIVSDHATWL